MAATHKTAWQRAVRVAKRMLVESPQQLSLFEGGF